MDLSSTTKRNAVRCLSTAEWNAAACSVVLVSVEQNTNISVGFSPSLSSCGTTDTTRTRNTIVGFKWIYVDSDTYECVIEKSPKKHRKRLRSQIGAVAASVFRCKYVEIQVFMPGYFSRRKFRNHIANKPFHIENYVIKIETERIIFTSL